MKKRVLKNFAKLTGKQLRQSFFFNKIAPAIEVLRRGFKHSEIFSSRRTSLIYD